MRQGIQGSKKAKGAFGGGLGPDTGVSKDEFQTYTWTVNNLKT